jgi:hypothetical protein
MTSRGHGSGGQLSRDLFHQCTKLRLDAGVFIQEVRKSACPSVRCNRPSVV